MGPADTSGPAVGLELLLERFRTGLNAERVVLEPDDAAAGDHDDPRMLRSAMPMQDGSQGVLLVQRGRDAPAFSDAERQLFVHLAALADTVLQVAAESAQRSQRLAVVQGVAAGISAAESAAAALGAAVDAVFEYSGYYAVTATLMDHEAGEQLIVADRSRALRNHTGMRRPLAAGLVGRAAQLGMPQLYGRAGDDPAFDWMGDTVYHSLVLAPVMVNGRCDAVLELSDTRADVFSEADLELIAAVAAQLSTALTRTHAIEESGHRAARLAVGSAVAAALTDARTPSEALALAAHTVFETSHYHLVAATLVLEEQAQQLLIADLSRGRGEPEQVRRPIEAGIVGAAILSHEQILLGDAQQDPRFDWPQPLSLNSLLVTPVLVDGRCVAALEIWDMHNDRFDRFDAALMQHVADHLAAAWRSIRLREESERRAQRLELTLEVTRSVAAATSPEGALAAAIDALVRSTAYQAMAAVLADHATGEQMLVAGRGPDREMPVGLRRPLADGLTGHVIEHRRPLRVDDAAAREDVRAWLDEPRFLSLLIMPVVVDGLCVATLELGDERAGRFSEQDMVLMATAAEQVAAALRRIGLRKESARRADRLALTAAIARRIASAGSVDEALEAAAETIYDATEYEVVSVIRCRHERGEAGMTFALDRSGLPWQEMSWPIEEGITGRTIASGRPLRLGRATQDPDYTWPGPERYESLVQAPVMVNGRCEAVLELADHAADRYSQDDEVLLITAAEQVAATIRGVGLRSQAELSAQRMALTLKAARAVAAADSADAVLETFVRTVHEGVGYDCVEATVPLWDSGEQVLIATVTETGEGTLGLRRPIDHGSTGRAFVEARQVHVHDTLAGPPLPGTVAAERWRSRLATPVIVDEAVVAVLGIADTAPDRFSDADELFMQTVAEQVGAALLGTRLRDESEERARRLEVTIEVAEAVAGSVTVEQALRAAAETLSRLVVCGAVTAFVADSDTGEQVALVDLDMHGNLIEGLRRPGGRGTTGEVFAQGVQVRIDRTSQQEGFVPWIETGLRYESVLLTPVTVADRVDAVIGLYDLSPHRFDHQDELLMLAVAEQIAAALRGAGLQSQLSQRAERLERLERRHRLLLGRLVLAQEQERSRVAADLHDDTVQVLSACVIALDRVRRSIGEGEVERAAATLSEVSQLISGAVDRTRRMTFELRPAVLWHNGLEAALRQLLSTVEAEWGMAVSFDVSGVEERLDATLETIAFRSIAELIANARTHSRGTRLSITLSTDEGNLHAIVSDDGRGFDLDQAIVRARATNHLGLEAMMERIDAAGGAIEIETAPGNGTTARLSLPVRPAS